MLATSLFVKKNIKCDYSLIELEQKEQFGNKLNVYLFIYFRHFVPAFECKKR